MKEFLEKLRQQVAENPPNYGDADSVLGLLYECFNENNPYNSKCNYDHHLGNFSW